MSAGQLPCAGLRGDAAARARARSRRARLKSSGEPPTGFVRRRKVGDNTRRLYSELGDGLLRAARLSRRSLESPEELDRFLDSQLTELYFAGATAQRARNLFYAVVWHRDVRPVRLPLSLGTLKGFGREHPDSTRDGVTWEEVLLISNALLKHPEEEYHLAACAAFLQFDTYPRPGPFMKLLVGHVLPPTRAKNSTCSKWCLVFHPSSETGFSKRRTQDDTDPVGSDFATHPGVAEVCHALHARSSRRGKAVPFVGLSLAVYERLVSLGAKEAGLGHITPHMLRHGGASHDALCGAPQDAVQQRGQWTAQRSCLRYMKHGRYLRRLNALPLGQVDLAHSLEASLAGRLCRAIRSHRT